MSSSDERPGDPAASREGDATSGGSDGAESAHASQPSLLIRVANAARLAEGQSQRFDFRRGKLAEEGFVLRWGGALQGFANSCPHWNVDLDYGTGEFYDVELERIVCRNHGALFHPQTGFCEWGPCSGHSLERFELETEGDDVLVRVPPTAPR